MSLPTTTEPRTTPERRYCDGRDELNLADFPISVLQRQQPVDADGKKLDTAVYQANRFDRRSRQRVAQKVTLETSSRHGLPTPADENVILALLYVAKHSHNFTSPVVHFAPRQLFDIMGWAPNSRSYERLREVLRRLKALVIRYENSWWDIEGRAYEAEVATGIISEYELGRQTGGRKKPGAPLPCWVTWTPHFQRSLSNGNLKKLDLERLFSLRLPTSQRMYRFLDKRFYPPHDPPEVDMDLHDFACGHIGLSRVDNVAELKRRLAPAIGELEAIGYIAPAEGTERFYKVRAGVWRVKFRTGPGFPAASRPVPRAAADVPVVAPRASGSSVADEAALVAEFYELWSPGDGTSAGEADVRQARDLIARHGKEQARALLPVLVQVVRRQWPDCKTLSGAVKYVPDALRLLAQRQRLEEQSTRFRAQARQTQAQTAEQGASRQRLEADWLALPVARREEIEGEVLGAHPALSRFPALLKEMCLNKVAAADSAPAGALQ